MKNYNIKIEQQILCTIFFDYDRFQKYHHMLKDSTFEYEIHQFIYKAMENLFNQDLPIDEEFLKKELEKQNKWNESIMMQIMTTSPLSNIEKYILELQKKHIERDTISLGIELQKGNITLEQLQLKLSSINNMYQNNKEIVEKNDINLDKLSPFLRNVIMDLEKINHHPISMILSTVLTSMAGLIGARAKINNGMFEVYPVIWSIIIAPSSLATKSTLTRYTKQCIFGNLQNELFEDYKDKLELYKEERKSYNNLSKEDKRNEIEPEKPEPKLLIFQNDGTPEAKLKSLEDNPYGGVIYYDEMRAELEKTNNDKGYKALKTSTFDGERFHKRLVNGGSIILDHPVICENGLITEQWLLDAVQKDDIASGFMARYLFSYNQKNDFRPLQIKPIKLNPQEYSKAGEFIIEMLNFECEEPHMFLLTVEAKEYYTKWFNELSITIYHTETNEEMTASLRLTTYVLKFALISYIFDMAYQEIDIIKSGSVAIPLQYIKEAIYIMEIFRNENDKVLDLLQKNNKLHKKLDSLSLKIQNKIRSTKNKRISRAKLLQGIRGLSANKLDSFIEQGLFKIEQIEKTNYIMEQ